jgi:hypothetical protein
MLINHNNNLNAMQQLEKKFDTNAGKLTKLSSSYNDKDDKNRQQESTSLNEEIDRKIDDNIDLVTMATNNLTMAIAYTANAEVISTNNNISQTLLNIKV